MGAHALLSLGSSTLQLMTAESAEQFADHGCRGVAPPAGRFVTSGRSTVRYVAANGMKALAGLTDIVPAALGEEVVVHGALALAKRKFRG